MCIRDSNTAISASVAADSNVSAGDKTNGIDLSKLANGDTVTINGKTYTMAGAADASKAQFNDLAELKKQVEADNKGYTLTTTTTNTKVTLAGTGNEPVSYTHLAVYKRQE